MPSRCIRAVPGRKRRLPDRAGKFSRLTQQGPVPRHQTYGSVNQTLRAAFWLTRHAGALRACRGCFLEVARASRRGWAGVWRRGF
jgi:hypothetical protein